MSSLKVSNAINKFIYAEKKSQIDEIKDYLRENVDEDDFTFNIDGEEKNLDDLCNLLDEFVNSIDKKMLKMKSTKKNAPKKTKKNTFYNHWLSKRLAKFAEEQRELDESERVDNKSRMKIIGPEWAKYKESDEYEEEKAKWEQDNSSLDDVPEKTPKKKAPKKKAPKKKAQKKKQNKVESDSDSDSDDDSDSN